MFGQTSLALSVFAASAFAQQRGAYTPEVHPSLPSQRCTLLGGCKTVNSSVVLDSAYRWLHSVGGYDACHPSGFDPKLCPTVADCAKNCALEGADYANMGIHTSGNALTLNLFTGTGNATTATSPRVYLLQDDETYNVFKLLNQEFTYDVDVSQVPCGVNGALYFSEMSGDGDKSALNQAGAAYGTGYCDAQCPKQTFIKGEANLDGTSGSCCNEMDIWEANNAATAFTPHPCNITGVYKCSGTLCGAGSDRYNGVCDEDGCDFNAYRNGQHDFYGPGKKVDTTKKFTVVTQFITNNLRSTGSLAQIRRIYIQNGRIIDNAVTNVKGIKPYNYISDDYCTNQKKVFGGENDFAAQGAMKGMGAALARGMVLAMSIWEDSGSYMQWLDSLAPADGNATTPGVARGNCPLSAGRPADIMAQYPNAKVVFSNIKSGELGSTFHLF